MRGVDITVVCVVVARGDAGCDGVGVIGDEYLVVVTDGAVVSAILVVFSVEGVVGLEDSFVVAIDGSGVTEVDVRGRAVVEETGVTGNGPNTKEK